MSEKIGVREFHKLSKLISVIDVRSPREFEIGHIPGAYNIPIFTNEERAIVGTTYKKEGKDPAVLKGLEIVGKKLRAFADTARKLSVNNKLLVHCWRGGMRSASMAWLFETVGIETYILEGGYKAFRNFGKTQLSKPNKLIILGGLTGSGKTEILLKIKENQPVIGVDPRYFRPTEVDLLIGDPSKSNKVLGWKPEFNLEALIADMMRSDIKLIKKESYLKEGGYKIMNYFE